MNSSDEQFFSAVKTSFDIITAMFVTDAFIILTDLEKIILVKPAKTFQLGVKEGDKLFSNVNKKGGSEKAIETKERQFLSFPKEVFGFCINTFAIPLINSDTGNVLGTIGVAISQEKEQSVLDSSKGLQTFSEELSNSVNQFAASAEELASSSQNMNSEINRIQEQINSMDDVVSYVKSIASTTNLLGLNASIEAAREGEHGRGFSVVAGEIRKLAYNTKDSATKISATLSSLKSDINGLIGFLENFAAISEEQAAQAQELASSSDKLNDVSENLTKIAETLF
jgi:uncharacterized protein YukE